MNCEWRNDDGDGDHGVVKCECVRWSMGSDLKKKYIIIALDSVLGS